MAKWGTCDFKQLQKLQENLNELQQIDLDRFCRDVSKELAARLLQLVIPLTPLGDYSKEIQVEAKRDSKHHKKGDIYTKRVNTSGKKGGTLRRGWTARSEAEAISGGGNIDPKVYAKSLPIVKRGDTYTIEVINPVHYASYVEFGHVQQPGRYVPAIGKSLKAGWVPGQYFLTTSEQKLKRLAPRLIEMKLERLLKEAFNV